MVRFERRALLAAPDGSPAAIGGEITAETVWSAFLDGVFLLPTEDPDVAELNALRDEEAVAAGRITVLPGVGDPYRTTWWCPARRPVVEPAAVRYGRHLTRTLRTCGWTATVDAAFDQVVRECRADRWPEWITPALADVMGELHRVGRAHSVEVWAGDELVGGVFGLARGPVFSIDSMFHRRSDAGKVAFAELARRADGTTLELIDIQVPTPHGSSLGVVEMAREAYLDRNQAAGGPVVFDTAAHPVDRLLDISRS
ncbi:MAG: leucyl/phenylalanyl-tRNA--protein transferase [Actinocatenispora sp.]